MSERTGFFIVQEGPIDTNGFGRINVHAGLVKCEDSPVGLIPKFLARNNITLGPNEKYKTVLGLYPPENIRASVDELYAMIEADPHRREAAKWLIAHVYQAGFSTGAEAGVNSFVDNKV